MGVFALKNRLFKGGGKMTFFCCFLMKKRPPYVIERPAVTASFSGGIDKLEEGTVTKILLDVVDFFYSVPC